MVFRLSLPLILTLSAVNRIVAASQGLQNEKREERSLVKNIFEGLAANIVLGTNAPEYESFAIPSGSGLCGATLIHEDILLTAAHCDGVFDDGILLGGTTIDNSDGVATFLDVDYQVQHPNYEGEPTEFNDIMLVKLQSPALNEPLQVLNFDSVIPSDSAEVKAIGYGKTAENGTYSYLLQEVVLDVETSERCDNTYNHFNDTIQICTYTPGKDTCQGDSGGPLLLNNVQVGITSHGAGCGQEYPGVFVRVSAYQDFIENGICQHSDNPPDDCPAPTSSPSSPPTASPVVTTATPVATTSNPVALPTTAPTVSPVATTSSPTSSPLSAAPSRSSVVITEAPVSSTSAAPAATTSSPVNSPSATPTRSSVVITEAPATSSTAPVATTSRPVNSPSATPTRSSVVITEAPMTSTTAPVATTSSPVNGPSATPITEDPVGQTTPGPSSAPVSAQPTVAPVTNAPFQGPTIDAGPSAACVEPEACPAFFGMGVKMHVDFLGLICLNRCQVPFLANLFQTVGFRCGECD